MKFGIAIAGAALALFGATAAQAQITLPLTITLTAGVPVTVGGISYIQYGGVVNNTSGNAVEIQGANLGSPTGVTNGVKFFSALEGQYADGTDDPDLSALPLTLNAGGAYQDTDLFELIVPANAPLTTLSYSLTGLPTGGTQGLIGVSGTFTVGTPPNNAVPEPGSVALLMSSMVGGGLFVARRRRK